MAEYDEDFTHSSPVGDRATRRSYLITCSQVNKATFPTRESFAGCVVNAFNSAPGAVRVDYCSSDIRQGQYFENGLGYIYWEGKIIFRTANKTALFCYWKLPGM